jgi:hypothetical protein
MTVLHADKILRALFAIGALADPDFTFTEGDLASQLGLSDHDWQADYKGIFEGMLHDRPATAPDSGARYRDVFVRVDKADASAVDHFQVTPYGRELLGLVSTSKGPSLETIELPRVGAAPDESLDGLRSWQAAVVRLWSDGLDSFAELSIGWYPADAENGPWVARLYCGDRANEGWVEDVQIVRASTIQSALQRLWDRAKARHGLFKDDPRLLLKTPADFPQDLWLTVAERALIERLVQHLRTSAPKTASRFTYHPDNRPNARWVMELHPYTMDPPQGTLYDAAGPTFLQALHALLERVEARLKAGELEKVDPAMRALMERKTDIGLDQTRIIQRKLSDGNREHTDPEEDTAVNIHPDTLKPDADDDVTNPATNEPG